MIKIRAAIEYVKAHSPNIPFKNRLESKFVRGVRNECWNWRGAVNPNGYGYLMVNIKAILASRLMWFFERGEIPGGMCICHKCDNRLCVNPNHLFLGTKKDNAQDAEKKGRLYHARGSKHGNSKLTEKDVIKIRQMHKGGRSIKGIARDYKMSDATIGSAIKRETWVHI